MWFVGFQTMVIVDQYGIPFHAVLVSIIFIKRKFRLRSFKPIKPSILFDTDMFFFNQWRPLLTSFSNRRHRECKKDAPCRKRDAPAVYCTLKMVQRLSYRAGERSDTLWVEFTNFIHTFLSFKTVKILFKLI